MDLERESPQLSGIKRKFATFLHEAEWLLFVVVDGFVYVFVLLLRQYFSDAQCFLIFSVSFPRNIYYCWNLVVRYEKWEWSLCRGMFSKEDDLLSCQLPWLPRACVSSVISVIKNTEGTWCTRQGVWAGLWVSLPTLGARRADGCFYFCWNLSHCLSSCWLSEDCLCTFGRRMVSSLTCLVSGNSRGQFCRSIVSCHWPPRVSLEMELVGLHEGGTRGQ